MTTELQPGGNLRLPPAGVVLIDLHWDPERPGGQEVEACAFLLGADGRVGGDEAFIFYNNPSACGGAIALAGSGAHRTLRIDPRALPDAVARVAFCLALLGPATFAEAGRVEVRLREAPGADFASFRPTTAGMSEAALILGEVYRYQGQWKFRAIAQGFAGGLGPLAEHFGVEIAADEPTPAASSPPPTRRPAPPTAGAPTLIKAPATGVLPSDSETRYSDAGRLSYEILYRDAYALARVDLPHGRRLKAQGDAMVAMSPTIAVEGTLSGGLLGGLGRLLSGESLFLQTLSAGRGAGAVYLAPASPGDIAAVEIRPGDGLVIQRGGFLACTEGVEVGTQVQNVAQGLFSGEGFFILEAHGEGLVLLESFGAIHELTLTAGEQKVVDNGHLVAWSRSMHYDLELGSRGLVAAFTSGENIVCRFHGPGRILLQTRQPRQFGRWVSQLLPG
ncbi:TIGR00266 family protein [Thiococcus pfennigii]|jgi:uncharacterized protein (TIGR00266 family)|uniref:TIGR00266 family protein n=1 Tax=Thiococcus pfennigii TaxID=1057 RepID=UPI0019064FFB|nr:TIGR00266 family protein [Thiococcus pfennigii]MBK1700860.1 TIGR00266 family protein [Thiococcus pfennigii]MBK1730473.1 TIGR00266 family protein [Thiococcus pfennigii]